MKEWINRTKGIILSSGGETLMESLVSLLVLTILLLTVTAMIKTSFNMSGATIKNATDEQETVNKLVLSDYGDDYFESDITFSSEDGISSTHGIKLFDSDGYIAFAPAGEEVEEP